MSFESARAAGSKPARRLGDRIPAAPGINPQLISKLRDGGTWRRSAKGRNADLGERTQKIMCGLHVLGLGLEFLHVRGLVPNSLDSHCGAEMLE